LLFEDGVAMKEGVRVGDRIFKVKMSLKYSRGETFFYKKLFGFSLNSA